MFPFAMWAMMHRTKDNSRGNKREFIGPDKISKELKHPRSALKLLTSRKVQNSFSKSHVRGEFSSLLAEKFHTKNEIFWNLKAETTINIY